MTTKEFIEYIANGTFSKNDVIMQSAPFPDKEDLIWDLWMADKACLESTGRPQVTDEVQISRIANAISIICEEYQIRLFESSRSLPDKPMKLPKYIAESKLALELLDKCKEAGLLDDDYQLLEDTSAWQRKQIASYISWLCDFPYKYRVFEDFWGVRNIDKVKDGNGDNPEYRKRMQIIEEIFENYQKAKNESVRSSKIEKFK